MAMETARTDSVGLVEHEVTLLLRRADAARKEREKEDVLDRAAYLLLGELERQGPLGVAALAHAFQLDVSTASRQTTALESKGFVARRPDPMDGRISLLETTPLGRERYQATRAARQALFEAILAGWTTAECRQFAAYLARLNRAIEQRAGGARATASASN